MFSAGDDDDGDFLVPAGRSKLASLFGSEQAPSASNEKLTYTAPKEPKKKKEGAGGSSTSPAVLHAVAVTAYKYVDGQHTNAVKLGAAILGNHVNKDYKLLLYVSKQQQVTHAMVNPNFSFVMQPNNYASFYDEARQSWSLLFESESAAVQFAKQVAITKANCYGGSLTDVVKQDLAGGEGSMLQVGDSAEVKYTGWLFTEHSFGQEFDSNANAEKLFRFKLGKGKIIKGWEDGMLGMRKGGRRVIVVPPHMAYGAKGAGNKVPPDSTLIFDVEVIRVKIATERDSSESSASSVAAESRPTPPQPETAAADDDSDSDDNSSVKERTRSITEQLEKNTPASGKAKLISRMAKMGRPMLPMTGAVPVQPDSDSDSQEISASPPSPKPMLPPKPAAHVASPAAPQPAIIPEHSMQPQPGMPVGYPPMAAQNAMHPHAMYAPTTQQQPQQPPAAVFQGVTMPSQMALYQTPHPGGMPQGMPGQHPYHFPHSNPQVFPQQFAAQVPTTQPLTSELPVLMSETRQNSSEVRLSISQVSDKIDRLAEKLDHWNREKNMSVMSSSSPNMETAVLMHNVQRIVSENERLKKELYEKSARVETQNEKIAELLMQNQRYVEQSHSFLEERNDAFKSTAVNSQTRVLALEQAKVKLVTELGDATSQIGNLHVEINNFRKNETELRQKLESTLSNNQKHTEELASLRNKLIDYESEIEQLSTSLKEDRQQRKQLEIKHGTLEEDMADLKATNKSLEKNLVEKKKKSAEEKKRLEEELDDSKAQHEKDVTKLKDSLRKQRSNTDAATASQVTALESELNKEWEDKCDRMVAAANDKHQRALKDIQEEKAQLEAKVKDMESKFSKLKSARSEGDKEVIELQEELDEMKAWKEKFETLKTQATAMKQRYEDQIREAEAERDHAVKDRNVAIDKARQAMSSATASAPVGASGGGGGDAEATAKEVKKIMNSVFHQVKSEFAANKTYKGADIHSTIMDTIKDVTLKMTQEQKQDEASDEESSEQDTEEEESEEEEEEEEESEEEREPTPPPVSKKRSASGKNRIPAVKSTVNDNKQKSESVKEARSRTTSAKEAKSETDHVKTKKSDVKSTKGSPEAIRSDVAKVSKKIKESEAPKAAVGVKGQLKGNGHVTSEEESDTDSGDDTRSVSDEEPKENDIDKKDSAVISVSLPDGVSDKGTSSLPVQTDAIEDVTEKEPHSVPADVMEDKEDSALANGDQHGTNDGTSEQDTPEALTADSHVAGDADSHVAGDADSHVAGDADSHVAGDADSHVAGDQSTADDPAQSENAGSDITDDTTNKPIETDDNQQLDVGNEVTDEMTVKPAETDDSQQLEEVSPGGDDTVRSEKTEEIDEQTKDESEPSPMEATSVQSNLEAMIMPTGAPVSGDRGNPYYAAELDKNRSRDDVIMPNVAPVSGDRGNPYYAAELEGKTYKPKDPLPSGGLSSLEASIIPSGTQPKAPAASSGLSALEASIIPDTSATTDSKSHGKSGLEASIIPDTSSSKQPKKSGASPLEASIIPNTSSSTSPGKSGAPSFEASITPAPNTGGRGNPYYDAELRNKDKKDVIMPKPAPNTGDKGNPYYEAHLHGTTVPEKSSPKSGGGSDFLSKLEGSIIPDASSDKKSDKKSSDKSKSGTSAPKSDFLSGLESQIVVDSGAEKTSKDKGKSAPDASGPKDPKKAKTENKAADKSLFGGDDSDSDEDMFTPISKNRSNSGQKEKAKASDTKKVNSESDDEMRKPPPLFGEDDDDNDLDWLS